MDNEEVKQPNPQTGPKQIDWIAAQQYYLESFTRTYADVAKKFDVSSQSVEQKGSAESWVNVRKELGEKAIMEFESNKIYEIAQVNTKHLKVFKTLMGIAALRLSVLRENKLAKTSDLKNIADVMEKAVNGERLVLGLPTRVSKSEIMGKLTTDLLLSPEQITKMDKFFKDES